MWRVSFCSNLLNQGIYAIMSGSRRSLFIAGGECQFESDELDFGVSMNRLKNELLYFWRQKLYVIALSLTAACGYGYSIVQPSIGIDDTAVALYLEEGLEVTMGRWTVFWLNKLFHVSDFAPFMTELVGVLFLMLAATIFNVLLRRIVGEKSGILMSTVFACVFVSNPIISEVFVYYWHDGVGLGYVLTALALLFFHEAMESKGRVRGLAYIKSLLFVWAAVGCYESFLILYILGIIVILFLWGMVDESRLRFGTTFKTLGVGAALCLGCVLLRSVMIAFTTGVFGLEGVMDNLKQEQRGLEEMMVLFSEGGRDELIMLMKRFWVVYHLNGIVYLPVTIYELACVVFGVASVFLAVRKKKIWYPVLFVGMLIAPFLLTLAEMNVSQYRSCQYLPFFAAAGVWLLGMAIMHIGRKGRIAASCVALIALVIVWNQAEFLNRSFYTDYRKYETTREMLLEIAYEIERDYGAGVPVVFTGHYETPYEFRKDYYVSYGSKQYQWIAIITDKIDPHLKEKYFTPQGYSFVGEASFPMIQWGFDAFDGTNREMMNFLKMHGHSFQLVTDEEVIRQANEIGDTMPRWPREGSITRQEGYVLVHI